VPVPCDGTQTAPSGTNDPLRTGWYPNQPGLNPNAGGQCAFGEQWAAQVSGQVYARPVVDPGTNLPNGTLVVATENNDIYGFDAVDGHQLWTRNLGVPWNSSDIGCFDVGQTVGITSTPAIDPATHTAYMTSKKYVAGVATYQAHAIDLATGNEKPNFPVTIQGMASNAPLVPFEPANLLQRPGLLLMNGVLYAAFGSLCDTPPYRGWVVGVNGSTGAVATRWTDVTTFPGPNPPEVGRPGGGIWQAGGHLVQDNGDILVVSGNGDIPPVPTPGTAGPATGALGESVIRLKVLPGGALQASDFWTPCNAQDLSDNDLDLGSGAPLVLPPPFPSNLLLVAGKAAPLYLLNRTDFGGYQQGGAGSCPDGTGTPGDKIVSSFSPGGIFGVWATPGVWPGDGGLIYLPYQPFLGSAKFIAYRVSGSGTPQLSIAGQSNDDPYGFGSSSAIVTSTGMTSGSALVWIVRLPGGDGVGAELRAYDPVPVNGTLTLRGRWSVGQGTKFNTPTVQNGRMYLGSQDGFVRAFGAVPQSAAAAQSPPPPPRARTTEAPDKGE
jgi:PQQ-like domain